MSAADDRINPAATTTGTTARTRMLRAAVTAAGAFVILGLGTAGPAAVTVTTASATPVVHPDRWADYDRYARKVAADEAATARLVQQVADDAARRAVDSPAVQRAAADAARTAAEATEARQKADAARKAAAARRAAAALADKQAQQAEKADAAQQAAQAAEQARADTTTAARAAARQAAETAARAVTPTVNSAAPAASILTTDILLPPAPNFDHAPGDEPPVGETDPNPAGQPSTTLPPFAAPAGTVTGADVLLDGTGPVTSGDLLTGVPAGPVTVPAELLAPAARATVDSAASDAAEAAALVVAAGLADEHTDAEADYRDASAARQRAQAAADQAAREKKQAEQRARLAGRWVLPVTDYRFSSPYGPRWGRLHGGVDLANGEGTTIRAAHTGVVVAAGDNNDGYGNKVVLWHDDDGVYTFYAHASKVVVSVGDKVSTGDKIAEMGNTGHSFGSHLHFEVHQGQMWNKVNPESFLTARGVRLR
jgi:biotin carboxyl carrier protein